MLRGKLLSSNSRKEKTYDERRPVAKLYRVKSVDDIVTLGGLATSTVRWQLRHRQVLAGASKFAWYAD